MVRIGSIVLMVCLILMIGLSGQVMAGQVAEKVAVQKNAVQKEAVQKDAIQKCDACSATEVAVVRGRWFFRARPVSRTVIRERRVIVGPVRSGCSNCP